MPDKSFPMAVIPFCLEDPQGRLWTFFKPADLDGLMDAIPDEQFEKDGRLPYWADNWPASLFLFNFLSQKEYPRTCRMLEIGCGLGIIATLLTQRGHRIVATDISADSCRFVKVQGSLHGTAPACVCSDWRKSCFKPSLDYIVGSDILYEQRAILPVIAFLKQGLKPSGCALIADPCRKYWNDFKTALHEHGFSWKLASSGLVNEGRTNAEIIIISR